MLPLLFLGQRELIMFKIFIGSSSEYRLYAERVQKILESLEGIAGEGWWDPQVFPTGESVFQALPYTLFKYDGAIMLASPDDATHHRGKEHRSAQGNVLIEYGMFLISCGSKKTCIAPFEGVRLPSNLDGVNHLKLLGEPISNPSQEHLDKFEQKNKDEIKQWAKQAKNAKKENIVEIGNSVGVLQKSNIEDVFDEFYRNAFWERKQEYDVLLCGGNLFRAFEPMHPSMNSSQGKPFDYEDIRKDIESLSLRGSLFQHLPQEAKLKLRVLLLNPSNPQIPTIEVHRAQRKEKTKGRISDKIYNTLYILDKIRNNPRIEDVDVRVTMSPIPFHVNWVEGHSIFVNNYLLGMRALDSPYAVYLNRDLKDKFYNFYTKHLDNFFREDFDIINIDFDSISGKGEVTYDIDLFKDLLDIYLRKKVPFSDKSKNPFATQKKLLSNYYDNVMRVWNDELTYPVQMEVNLTDECNQGCSWCISENILNKPPKNLKVDDNFKEFLFDFQGKGGKCLAWSGGGEPTRHPDFVKAIDYASEAKIKQGLFTNGDYDSSLNEHIGKHMEWVRFSVDTHRPTAYQKHRRSTSLSFERVCENIEQLVEYRNLKVGLNANISYWNFEDLEGLYDLAKNTKASYLQIRPVLPRPMVENEGDRVLSESKIIELYLRLFKLEKQTRDQDTKLIVSYDKFEDLKTWHIKNEDPHSDITTYQGCSSHNLFVALNCDGALSVCMYHLFDDNYVFGNIYSESYEKIWQGNGSENRRQKVVSRCRSLNHEEAGCQVCCKGHEINKILIGKKTPQGKSCADDFL